MRSFVEFVVGPKPIYVRKDGDVAYDLSEDVFVPEIGIKESRESYRKRLKQIREAALPKNWKGMVS
jgi:hypothetical protein